MSHGHKQLSQDEIIPELDDSPFDRTGFLIRGEIWTLTGTQGKHHVKMKVEIEMVLLHGLQPARLLCPWNSPGKHTGVGSHSLLKGIFLTKGSNLGLLHCGQILYHLSHQEGSYTNQVCTVSYTNQRSLGKHQKPGKRVEQIPSHNTQKEPHQHFDLGLPASGTVRQHISLTPPTFMVLCYSNPQQTKNTVIYSSKHVRFPTRHTCTLTSHSLGTILFRAQSSQNCLHFIPKHPQLYVVTI